MTVRIDEKKCNGCGQARETLCEAICPGNLLYKNEANLAAIRDSRDCWDCAACIKECPRQAIELYLPFQAGGRGAGLKARKEGAKIIWTIRYPGGDTRTIETCNQNIFHL